MAIRETEALTDEAADWFARLMGAHVSAQDREAFEAWVEADPARAVAYARVEATWERSARLAAVSPAAGEPRPIPRDPLVSRRMAAGMAATLGLGAVAAGAGVVILNRPQAYRTAVGERRTVMLPDGGKVVLNTATRLQVRYTEARRDVTLLEGEAQFEVAKDTARPFIVTAGEAVVRAVGTAFNVRLRGQVAEVTVTEGVVAVGDRTIARQTLATPAAAPHVRAGAGAVIGPGAVAKVALDADAMQTRTAWQQGLIELRGETLEQAAAEFNRYSDRKLVIGDARLASIRVGGTFGISESTKFVGALESGFGVRAVQGEGGSIYLVPAT